MDFAKFGVIAQIIKLHVDMFSDTLFQCAIFFLNAYIHKLRYIMNVHSQYMQILVNKSITMPVHQSNKNKEKKNIFSVVIKAVFDEDITCDNLLCNNFKLVEQNCENC